VVGRKVFLKSIEFLTDLLIGVLMAFETNINNSDYNTDLGH
jgi:hypothetical protein